MKVRLTIAVPDWLDRICSWPILTYRRLRFGHPYRKIRLTDVPAPASSRQGAGVAQAKSEGKFTIVDPDVFYLLNSFNWLCSGKDNNLYAARVVRSKTGRLNTIYMHRQIYFNCSTVQLSNFSRSPLGAESPMGRSVVDHSNTNSLDNRMANLRLATHSQNSCNTRRDKSKTYSRYRGVSFSKRKQKWFAAIRHNGKKIWLGYFKTEIEAARAYDEAARIYHKEFARLNFSK